MTLAPRDDLDTVQASAWGPTIKITDPAGVFFSRR
jgi:hypothetical protein